MKLKIYIILQNENGGYDTYSDAVVIAESEEEAKRMHPAGKQNIDSEGYFIDELGRINYGTWAYNISEVKVVYIGEAKEGSNKGIVCASFHAG